MPLVGRDGKMASFPTYSDTKKENEQLKKENDVLREVAKDLADAERILSIAANIAREKRKAERLCFKKEVRNGISIPSPRFSTYEKART